MIMNDIELSFILTISSFLFAISLAYAIYLYKIYNERKLTYRLFAARDSLIRCVAVNAISSDDLLFKLFYLNVNKLINSVHSDFFSLSNFVKRIQEFESSEQLKKGSNYISLELKKRSPQFQEAVKQILLASQEIMIEKNLTLKIIVKFYIGTIFLKSTLFIISEKTQSLLKNKANYFEYQKLEELKSLIN